MDVYASILVLNFNKNNSTVEQTQIYAKSQGIMVYVFPNKNIRTIDKNSLSEIFYSVSELNSPIDTIVFSGHASANSFSGKDGEIKQSDIREVMQGFPGIGQSVEKLILRGCYTGRISEVLPENGWRTIFKNLSYLAGYTDRAWSSETIYSKYFIFDTLNLSEDFLYSSTKDKSIAIFKSIRYFKKSAISIWFKSGKSEDELYITTETLNSKNDLLNISSLEKECHSLSKKRLKNQVLLEKYFIGNVSGFKRPPNNTNNTSLRKAYSWTLKNQHCTDLRVWQKNMYDDTELAASLLFYNKLAHNFLNTYNPYEFSFLINELNAHLETPLNNPDINLASRDEIRKFTYSLGTQLYNKYTNGLISLLDKNIITTLEYYQVGF